jgi:hypothetical protein
MTTFGSDITWTTPATDADKQAERPLVNFDRRTVTEAGWRIGAELAEGQVDQAHKLYDSVVNQIRNDNSNPTPQVTADARLTLLHEAMWQRNPADVKTPSYGMAAGYYMVYWKPEMLVNETMQKLAELQKKIGPSGNFSIATENDQTEVGQGLRDINEHLRTSLPDGLSRWIFQRDFNRRPGGTGVVAKIDQSINIKMEGYRTLGVRSYYDPRF